VKAGSEISIGHVRKELDELNAEADIEVWMRNYFRNSRMS